MVLYNLPPIGTPERHEYDIHEVEQLAHGVLEVSAPMDTILCETFERLVELAGTREFLLASSQLSHYTDWIRCVRTDKHNQGYIAPWGMVQSIRYPHDQRAAAKLSAAARSFLNYLASGSPAVNKGAALSAEHLDILSNAPPPPVLPKNFQNIVFDTQEVLKMNLQREGFSASAIHASSTKGSLVGEQSLHMEERIPFTGNSIETIPSCSQVYYEHLPPMFNTYGRSSKVSVESFVRFLASGQLTEAVHTTCGLATLRHNLTVVDVAPKREHMGQASEDKVVAQKLAKQRATAERVLAAKNAEIRATEIAAEADMFRKLACENLAATAAASQARRRQQAANAAAAKKKREAAVQRREEEDSAMGEFVERTPRQDPMQLSQEQPLGSQSLSAEELQSLVDWQTARDASGLGGASDGFKPMTTEPVYRNPRSRAASGSSHAVPPATPSPHRSRGKSSTPKNVTSNRTAGSRPSPFAMPSNAGSQQQHISSAPSSTTLHQLSLGMTPGMQQFASYPGVVASSQLPFSPTGYPMYAASYYPSFGGPTSSSGPAYTSIYGSAYGSAGLLQGYGTSTHPGASPYLPSYLSGTYATCPATSPPSTSASPQRYVPGSYTGTGPGPSSSSSLSSGLWTPHTATTTTTSSSSAHHPSTYASDHLVFKVPGGGPMTTSGKRKRNDSGSSSVASDGCSSSGHGRGTSPSSLEITQSIEAERWLKDQERKKVQSAKSKIGTGGVGSKPRAPRKGKKNAAKAGGGGGGGGGPGKGEVDLAAIAVATD
ncbi:hypothetical protein HKX48_001039 [Thoreauomyces humboldtii]|nr:hypothetical protein HKX48_001039 [Thoreauomyces humboldtii]